MARRKLQRFDENTGFSHMFQPTWEELKAGFFLKGKWKDVFFKNQNPVVLELGCGKGEYTVGLAAAYPDKNFIGIDIKGSRMWVGCKRAIDAQLHNVAFVRRHISGIEYLFEKTEVDEIWITFPDPHLREREAQKRLTSPEFITRYEKILKPGGKIHLKTDDITLYEFTLEVIEKNGYQTLQKSSDVYGDKVEGDVTRFTTYYEKMWLEQGSAIKYVCFVPFSNQDSDNNENTFFNKVLEVTRQIPAGRVTTYGAIAKHLGSAGSSRMVGWALNSSANAHPPVPAHRVVNRNGLLTGKFHFGGIEAMQKLLESEGVKVVDDVVVNFKELFWEP